MILWLKYLQPDLIKFQISYLFLFWDYDNNLTPWYKSIRVIKFKDSIKNTMNEVNKLINDFTWK